MVLETMTATVLKKMTETGYDFVTDLMRSDNSNDYYNYDNKDIQEITTYFLISLFPNPNDIDRFISIMVKKSVDKFSERFEGLELQELERGLKKEIEESLNLTKYKKPKKTVYYYASEWFNLLDNSEKENKDMSELFYDSIFETIVNKYKSIPEHYDIILEHLPMMMKIEERRVYKKYKLIYGV